MKDSTKDPNDRLTRTFFVVVVLAAIAIVGWGTALALKYHFAHPAVVETVKKPGELGRHAGLHGVVTVEKRAGQPHVILTLTDGEGEPVSGARAQAQFTHPDADSPEAAISLIPDKDGRYIGSWQPPISGVWYVRVSAKRGKDSFVTSIEVNVD